RRSASTSACGRPPSCVQPRPTMTPSLTITAPTAGFGAVRPIPRRPRSSARRMKRRSSAFAVVSVIIHERSFSPPPAKRWGGVGGCGAKRSEEEPPPRQLRCRPSPPLAIARGGREKKASFLSWRIRLRLFRQLRQRSLEVLGLAEILVDRGEAHIGDVVDVAQLLHHRLADRLGRDLVLAEAFQFA